MRGNSTRICRAGALCGWLIVMLASAGRSAPNGTPATTAADLAAVRREAAWILSAQLPDGAIAHYPDRVRIVPYWSGFGARGLVSAYRVTGDRQYLEAVWHWLEWYAAHEDPHGFVTDYTVTTTLDAAPGRRQYTETTTGDMDSTDAYAGLFLSAAEQAWEASHDRVRLKSLGPGIAGAVRAIAATQQPDGLTWAKPKWHVKYLMDQVETWEGLNAAVRLARALHDPALEQRAIEMEQRLRQGMESLWDPAKGCYDWALHENGNREHTLWEKLPEACQQAWAVAFGAATGERARTLMTHFLQAQPHWSEPTAVGNYWPVVGWAFERAGMAAEARGGLAQIEAGAAAAKYVWPYNPAIAGQLIELRRRLQPSPW